LLLSGMLVGSTQEGTGSAKENSLAPTWTSLIGTFGGGDWAPAPPGAVKANKKNAPAARAADKKFIAVPRLDYDPTATTCASDIASRQRRKAIRGDVVAASL
jgi:hypothetical protein